MYRGVLPSAVTPASHHTHCHFRWFLIAALARTMHALVLCKLHDLRRKPEPLHPVATTIAMLSASQQSFSQHSKAVSILAHDIGLTSLGDAIEQGHLDASEDNIALRDEALQNAYEMVLQQLNGDDNIDAWMRRACLLHLKVVDMSDNGGSSAGNVPGGWLDGDVIVARGSQALADAVALYENVRRLIPEAQPWVDAIAAPDGATVVGTDTECSDVETWLPALKRRRTKLILARDNDTIGRLCVRYGSTSANDLRELNPELVSNGFGVRVDARLRRNTQVCVYCDDDDDCQDDSHNNSE
ncbi:MAG: hypothetical protein CMM87_05400 [Rickettsiales bacterium]|nr:hypothetical protein [Rickettsiales bacterium]